MFVPPAIIPHHVVPSNVIVENKTIVYSDTVLPINDIGKNIKVTSISHLEDYLLEDCLRTIFASNPNVVFKTIQYSRNNKKVYFYTDKEISIDAWKDFFIVKHDHLSSNEDIEKEIERVLGSQDIQLESCISLYDIAKLMKKWHSDYDNVKYKYIRSLEKIVKAKISNLAEIVVSDFDYDKKELKIGFRYFWYDLEKNDDFKYITFVKENGDLYIDKSETYMAQKIFSCLATELSKLYDEFLEYMPIKKEGSYDIAAINSNFLISIDFYEVNILIHDNDNYFKEIFKLTWPNYSNEYRYDECNSSLVLSTLQGREEELFKKIFVRISSCPSWCQPILYEIRKKQLE